MANSPVISYAQNREDIILSAFFLGQKKGFYVDIGAGDPLVDSVTKYFYDLGWHGLNIEPNPRMLHSLTAERTRDINLGVAASDTSGKQKFREYEGYGLSTLSKERQQELADGKLPGSHKFKDYDVTVLPLKQILEDAGVEEIDFMKIDVEGYEDKVISGNDWDKYRPKVICIEASHVMTEWAGKLKTSGYKLVFNDGLNDYYTDTKLKPALEFNYLQAAVARVIVPSTATRHLGDLSSLNSDLNNALTQVGKLELQNNLIREKIAPLIYENEDLRRQLTERKRIRRQVKDLLMSLDDNFRMHITRLNSRDTAPLKEAASKFMQNASPADVLQEIRKRDVSAFYDQKNGIAAKDKRAYTVVMGTYMFIRRVARGIVVGLWLGIKSLRKVVAWR